MTFVSDFCDLDVFFSVIFSNVCYFKKLSDIFLSTSLTCFEGFRAFLEVVCQWEKCGVVWRHLVPFGNIFNCVWVTLHRI